MTKPAAPARDPHLVLFSMKRLALSSVLVVTGLCGTASARPDLDLELGNSFDAPIGGKAYTQLVDTSYTASLRFSANFKVAHDVSIGPSIEADGQPVNSDEGIFNSASTGPPGPHRNATLARGRGLAGVKLVVRAPHIELWVRAQAGVDSIDGKVTQPLVNTAAGKVMYPEGPTVHVKSTVATFVPEVALVVPISRAFIGLAVSTPAAFGHKIAPVYANTPAVPPATPVAQPATSRGNAVDLQLGLIAGVRL